MTHLEILKRLAILQADPTCNFKDEVVIYDFTALANYVEGLENYLRSIAYGPTELSIEKAAVQRNDYKLRARAALGE